jgi:hypothetical protein
VVGPLELFYDLAVVVLVAQAARHLAGHLTWHGLGEFAVVFTLVWIAWANGSLHHELHGQRRFSSAWRSFSCSASPGDSPSRTTWQTQPNHPPGNAARRPTAYWSPRSRSRRRPSRSG